MRVGEVAAVRSIRKRGPAEAAWQVDARAPLQQLLHQRQMAVDCGGEQQGVGCGLTVASSSRAERVDQPALAQPLDHLLQLALCRRMLDLFGK